MREFSKILWTLTLWAVFIVTTACLIASMTTTPEYPIADRIEAIAWLGIYLYCTWKLGKRAGQKSGLKKAHKTEETAELAAGKKTVREEARKELLEFEQFWREDR